jgi:hypothetical protein
MYNKLWNKLIVPPYSIISPADWKHLLLNLRLFSTTLPLRFVHRLNLIYSLQPCPHVVQSTAYIQQPLSVSWVMGRHRQFQAAERALKTAHSPFGCLTTSHALASRTIKAPTVTGSLVRCPPERHFRGAVRILMLATVYGMLAASYIRATPQNKRQ